MSSNSNVELALSTAELKENELKECTPNLMPFHIGYDGAAPVSTYMQVKSVERGVGMPDGQSDESRHESTFRGRRIHGKDVQVPGGYIGVVVRSEGGEETGRRFVVPAGVFLGVRVWGADTPVDGGRDEYVRSLEEWTALADEVSGTERGKDLPNVAQMHRGE